MNGVELQLEMAAVTPHVVAVALCAARLLPVVFLCPALGGEAAPSSVKLSVVLALAGFVHFAGGVHVEAPVTDPLHFGATAARELAFGVALGLISSLPFDCAQMAGRFIDLFRGSSAEATLPQAGSRESALGDGLYQLLVAWVAVGALLPMTLNTLLRSYAVVRLGAFVHTESAAMHVVALCGTALSTGLALGAPVAAASLAIDCVMGLTSKAVPALHLHDISAPAKILAGGAGLWLTLGLVSQRLLAEVTASGGALDTLMELGR